MVFLEDGSYTSTLMDSTGRATSDIETGEYSIVGDSLHAHRHDGPTLAFAIQWHNENGLRLVRDTSIIVLERYQE